MELLSKILFWPWFYIVVLELTFFPMHTFFPYSFWTFYGNSFLFPFLFGHFFSLISVQFPFNFSQFLFFFVLYSFFIQSGSDFGFLPIFFFFQIWFFQKNFCHKCLSNLIQLTEVQGQEMWIKFEIFLDVFHYYSTKVINAKIWSRENLPQRKLKRIYDESQVELKRENQW